MTDKVLIDTSIWIDFFRDQSLKTSQELAVLIDEDRALLTGIVITELLRGAKDTSELKTILQLLEPVASVHPDEKTWYAAGDLSFRLARKGYAIFTVDAIIAATAIQHQTLLFSGDKHFSQIAAHTELKLFR